MAMNRWMLWQDGEWWYLDCTDPSEIRRLAVVKRDDPQARPTHTEYWAAYGVFDEGRSVDDHDPMHRGRSSQDCKRVVEEAFGW